MVGVRRTLTRQRLRRLLIVAALVYVYFVGGYLNNTMTNSIAQLTLALVNDRALKIDDYQFYPYDISRHDGHYYSGMPPGLSFVLVPVYLATKLPLALVPEGARAAIESRLFAGVKTRAKDLHPSKLRLDVAVLLVIGVLALAIPLTVAVTHAWLALARATFPEDEGVFLPVLALLLLGSAWGCFTSTLYHTMLGASLVWLGFCESTLRWGKTRATWSELALGLGLFWAVAADYPSIAYCTIVAVYHLLSLPRAQRLKCGLLFGAGAAASLGLLGWYHFDAFGSPWTTAYQARVEPLTVLPKGLSSFIPGFGQLRRTLIDDRCGVVFYHPTVLTGLVGAALSLRRAYRAGDTRGGLMWLAALGVMLANLAYYTVLDASLNPAGASYGARYTLYSVPFGMWASIPLFAALERRAPRWGVGLVVAGLALPAWPYFLYGSPDQTLARYAELLTTVGPAGYSLFKLADAGILRSPVLAWLGFSALSATCAWIWFRPTQAAHGKPQTRDRPG